jgi:hypothetical protein
MEGSLKTPEEFAQAMNERKADPSKVAKSLPPDPTSRSVGVILCAVGFMGLGYSYLTISQALGHAHEITYSWKIVLTSPMVLFIGIAWVILGEKGPRILGSAYSPSRVGWVFYVASFIASLALCYAFGRYLQSLGYDVGF